MIRPLFATAAVLCVAVAGCGSSTSSSTSFKGADHEVAQTIGNLQSYATGNEAGKICSHVLKASTVQGLGGQSGCEQALKKQLGQVDSFELSTKSVQVSGNTATAKVESIVSGKKKVQQVSLAKEGSTWKITSLE